MGSRGWEWQKTLGHLPKSAFLYFSSYRARRVSGQVDEKEKKTEEGPRAYHLSQASSSDDIAGVYEAVEVAGRLLYGFSHVIVAVEVEDIGDQIEGILIVLDFRVKAGQVETIGKIVLVDLAEVLVAARRDELERGKERDS